jgi:hypothetical protein
MICTGLQNTSKHIISGIPLLILTCDSFKSHSNAELDQTTLFSHITDKEIEVQRDGMTGIDYPYPKPQS